MEYTQGDIARVFIAKFSHGEDPLDGIKKIVLSEGISCATINLLGALSEADIVTGPVKTEIPPVPNEMSFREGREIIGFGVVTSNGKEPLIHLHASFVRGESSFTGCLRKNGKVFVVIEAVILELTGANVSREFDPETRCNMLNTDTKGKK